MNKTVRIAAATSIILAGLPSLPAQAVDPTPPDAGSRSGRPNTPANEGSSSGIRINPSNTTAGQQTLADIAIPEPPRVGPLSGVGTFLLDHGVNFHPAFIDHFWANPSTGINKGETYNLGILSLAADVDLGRLVGLTGGNIHVVYTVLPFKSDVPQIVSQAGGFLTGYQTTPALSNSKIALLTYEQKLFNDRLSIEAGRTNPYRYFFLNNSLDPFNSVSSTLSIDGDLVPFINPTWGGRVKYNLDSAWYVQAGAFEDYWRRSIVRPFDLNTSGAYGAQVIGELGYRTEFNTAAYPANLEAGLEWNTRNGYGNFKGSARPALVTTTVGRRTVTVATTAADYSGGGVIFTQGKKVIWRGADNPGFQPKNVAVYGSFDLAVDKPQPIDMDVIAGVDFTGFIPGRPADALEFQVHYQRLSQLEANFESATQRRVAGIGSAQSRNNYAFQATGNVQLTSAISLRPYVQYFTAPDTYYLPTGGRSHDGWGAGLLTTIGLGRLLGLSAL